MAQIIEHPVFDWARASWDEAEDKVNHWGDGNGLEIDPLILPLVVGLNLAGVRTIQSCEGHLGHGFAYPWVMFERPICPCYAAEWQACQDTTDSPELDAYRASHRLLEALDECPHRPEETLRLASLLAKFYAHSDKSQANLLLECTGGDFYRLIAVTAGFQEDKAETLARCQAEMARFACFLKQRVLSLLHSPSFA